MSGDYEMVGKNGDVEDGGSSSSSSSSEDVRVDVTDGQNPVPVSFLLW